MKCSCGYTNNDRSTYCVECGQFLSRKPATVFRPIWLGILGMVLYYGGIWLLGAVQNANISIGR